MATTELYTGAQQHQMYGRRSRASDLFTFKSKDHKGSRGGWTQGRRTQIAEKQFRNRLKTMRAQYLEDIEKDDWLYVGQCSFDDL